MTTTGRTRSERVRLLLILGLLTALGPFSIDMYLPAFPDIAKGLHTTVSQVMLSLSSFLLGISVGQLLYGPLLERYGRKKPLYVGLALYVLASVGCAMAGSVHALILFRLLQALGGCVGMVASRAVVRDLFAVEENAKVFSTLMLVVAVSPIIAPTLGGYVTAALGWRYVFGILLVVAALILAGVLFLLPESREPNPDHSLHIGSVLRNYWSILVQPQFYTYALTGAVAYAGLSAYVSGSPEVFMGGFGITERQFGWVFAIIAVGIISASQLNSYVLGRSSSERIIRVALLCQNAVGMLLVVLALTGLENLYATIALIFLFLSCQGFTFPNASALSMASFGHQAGTASALMGAVQMGIGAGTSVLVSMLANGTLLPMAGVMASCSIAASIVYWLGRKAIGRKASGEALVTEEVDMITKF
jgi:DHA1 family bicyclomycin/chloramphenicol resistance-like MFS transporter